MTIIQKIRAGKFGRYSIHGCGVAVQSHRTQKTDPKRFVELIKKYADITEITDEMLFELVDRVEVHKATGGRGRYRQQKIDIHFNFWGDYKPFGKEMPEREHKALIDKEYAEKREKYRRTSYRNRQTKIEQLKTDAENGDEDAVRERYTVAGELLPGKENCRCSTCDGG